MPVVKYQLKLQPCNFVITALVLFFISFFANAQEKCERLFRASTTEEAIQHIDNVNNQFFTKNVAKDFYLKKIVKKIDIQKANNPLQLEQAASEITLALFGKRHLIRDYFFKNAGERFRSEVLRQISERILQTGLLSFWNKADPESPGQLSRFKNSWLRFQRTYLFDLFMNFPLPGLRPIKLSDELITKVIFDGIDVHEAELKKAMASNSWRNGYLTFRKAVSTLLFTAIVGSGIFQVYGQAATEIQNWEDNTSHIAAQIRSLPAGLHGDLAQVYQRLKTDAVAEFKKQWGEAPTQDEMQELLGEAVVQMHLNSQRPSDSQSLRD